MKVAVIGGTGLVGSAVTRQLEERGYQAVPVSRSSGADLMLGTGLRSSFDGVATVIDVCNTNTSASAEMIEFFRISAANIVAAETDAGVSHHVLLSIIGVDQTKDYAHFAGKLAQEDAVQHGGVAYTILRSTQFFDFAESAVRWGTRGTASYVPPLLMQPISVEDVASSLVDAVATGPVNEILEIAGPERHDLVDMARRTLQARGLTVELVPSWQESGFGVEMAGDLLLPHDHAHIATATFEEWLTSLALADQPRTRQI